GYQPVGMKPIGWTLAGSLTLNTARLLASALATNRILPSPERHRLLGVLPDGAWGERAQWSVGSAWPSAASRMLTRVELAQATNSVLPSGLRAISVGWLSVFHVAAIRSPVRSMTATPARFHRLTNRRLPSGCGRQAEGNVSFSNGPRRFFSGGSTGRPHPPSPTRPAAQRALPAWSPHRTRGVDFSLP